MLPTNVDAAHVAMRNWARWASDDDHRLSIPPPPWASGYRASAAWEAGWGDPGAPDALPEPVDERAAMALDRVLRRLPRSTFVTLRRHYLKGATQPEIELQAALRRLVDVVRADAERVQIPLQGVTNPSIPTTGG